MIDQIKQYIEEVKNFHSTNATEIEEFRIKFLGKKGILTDLFTQFKAVPNELKKEFGQVVNELKTIATEKSTVLKNEISNDGKTDVSLDLTRPGEPFTLGSRHPINITKNRIIEIFNRIGFSVSEGPEIEDDWHNFTALNLPTYHPARDMQDTFSSKKIQILYCVPTLHLFKFVTWRTINHQCVSWRQVVFIVTKLFRLVRT